MSDTAIGCNHANHVLRPEKMGDCVEPVIPGMKRCSGENVKPDSFE